MANQKPETVHWPSAVAGDIEDQHGAKVFEIRDFGSRAKNMAGPNSDIDAMVLFDQPAMDSKLLHEYTDTVVTEMYGVDIQGWNLRKFADLLADSNPQTLEFLNSPAIYYTAYPEGTIHKAFDELRHYANRNFNPIRLYMHYRSMAKSNYTKYTLRKVLPSDEDKQYELVDESETEYITKPLDTDDDYKRKFRKENEGERYRLATTDRSITRNLKVVRAALYARHVRRTKQFPEMDFRAFLAHSVDSEIQERVEDMLDAKQQGLADMESGNPFRDIIEYELNYDVDHEELNIRGISTEKVNDFITEIDQFLWD